MKAKITHERLLEVVHYDPEAGIFTQRMRRNGCRRAILGTRHTEGYLVIYIDGRTYGAHRLAWFYVHGEWPKYQIDHRDLDKKNNRISNLRDATKANNSANKPIMSTNTSGFKGVFPLRNKWGGRICFNKKIHHLGTFDTREEAHAAYAEAARRLFGEFPRAA